jgi:CRISPR-associated protein Csd1
MEDKNPERTRESFEAFRKRHLELEPQVNHPWFSAVCSFLKNWSPEKALDHSKELEEITQNFGVFRISGERKFVHDVIGPLSTNEDSPLIGACLVTGREGSVIARLHEPKIKGVNGSQGAGALLVSFNASAYESYDKNQSYNAPVSSDAAFKYTNALNYLLRQNERRILLGDATIVFWAEQPTELEKFISDLFGNTPRESEKQSAVEDRERVRQARQFLTQLRDGTETTEAIAKDNKTSFFILGLSPNNARLSVRLWVDTNVGELKQRLGQHLRDLALEDGREGTLPPSLRQIVAATGRAELQQGRFKGFDTKHVSPLLAASLARAVLTGGAYPQSLLTSLIRRIHADGVINTHRCAAIKACLVRGWRLQGFQKEVGVALDRNLADPAYNVGRLFALLEKIQTDSVDGELNATIKDRYFSSASSTPAVVFPRLLRLNQHHLAKLATGSRIYYDKLLGEVMSKLSSFPRHLPLEDQGQFAIGYFHQRQDLFKSKKSESQGDQQ